MLTYSDIGNLGNRLPRAPCYSLDRILACADGLKQTDDLSGSEKKTRPPLYATFTLKGLCSCK